MGGVGGPPAGFRLTSLRDRPAKFSARLLRSGGLTLPRPDRQAWRDALPRGAILVEADGIQTPGLAGWLPEQGFLGRTEAPAHEVVFALRQGLGETSAPLAGVHGVFVRIFGLGVLLLGASGIGKSELALELVTRGHRLVADDHVDIRRPAPGILTGACPPGLAGVIEVRGLGFLDLARMFGPARVDPRPCRLDLAIRLEQGEWQLSADERLGGRRGTWELHGTGVPILTLPFRLGHNPAVLVEAACRDQWLRLFGFDAGHMLMERLMPPVATAGA